VAVGTYLATGGEDRLVISTIRAHLPFFHEAGFQLRTERRQRVPFALWNPSTWRGERWTPSVEAMQPSGLRCVFIQRGDIERDPQDFAASTETRDGVVKMSCEYMLSRAHCVHVVGTEQPASVQPAEETDDARGVVNVRLRFTYDGQEHELWHAPRRAALRRVTHVDKASTRAR
jgi:hypothetical protein